MTRLFMCALVCAALAGCDDSTHGQGGRGAAGDAAADARPAAHDAGPADATRPDAVAPDALPADATPADMTPADMTPADMTSPDAAPVDAARPDAAPVDAAPPDAAPMDANRTDMAPPDMAAPDMAPRDVAVPDAMPPDAAPDAAPPDASPPDAGPLDPATCPIGDADGCCPLLRNGGVDPDCPVFACDVPQQSEPILLDDSYHGPLGQVSMAWNGHDLALVRTDGDDGTEDAVIVFERRDLNGAPIAAPVRLPSPAGHYWDRGTTGLAFDPRTGTYVYAHPIRNMLEMVALDGDGRLLWHVRTGGQCNGLYAIVEVFISGDRVAVASRGQSCDGSSNPEVDVYALADGRALGHFQFGDGERPRNSYEPAFACAPGCAQLLTIWYRNWEHTLRARSLDLGTLELGAAVDLVRYPPTAASPDHTALAFGADRFLYWLGRVGDDELHPVDLENVGLGDPQVLGAPRALPPTMAWTGSGYLLAAATFHGSAADPHPGRSEYRGELWHVAPDGTRRDTRSIEPGEAVLYPDLAWAGGPVALTWVRHDDDRERRYLSFLTCP